ncbi:MAG: phage regulatory CII family protein [Myxococcota bacterium]
MKRIVLTAFAEGMGASIVDLPLADGIDDDVVTAANAAREATSAAAALIEAAVDGKIDAREGARIVDECDDAIAALMAIRERGRLAVQERVVGRLRAVPE